MKSGWPRLCVASLWLLGTGCTALREIPPSQYAAAPERRHVRVVTRAGLSYEFDFVKVAGDSLLGYRRRDVGGPAEDYATLAVPLEDVARLSARGVDWYRTGLIGGGVLAAVVAAGLSARSDNSSGSETSGGGTPRIP